MPWLGWISMRNRARWSRSWDPTDRGSPRSLDSSSGSSSRAGARRSIGGSRPHAGVRSSARAGSACCHSTRSPRFRCRSRSWSRWAATRTSVAGGVGGIYLRAVLRHRHHAGRTAVGRAQARCAVHCRRRLGGVGGSAAPPRRSLHSHAGGQTHTKARAAPHVRATGLPNRKPALADCPHTGYLAHLIRQVESAAHRVLDSM